MTGVRAGEEQVSGHLGVAGFAAQCCPCRENLRDALDPSSGGGIRRQLKRWWGLCEKENEEAEANQKPLRMLVQRPGMEMEPSQYLPGLGLRPVAGPLVSTVRSIHPVPPFLVNSIWFSTPWRLILGSLGPNPAAACQGAEERGAGLGQECGGQPAAPGSRAQREAAGAS